MISLPLPKGYRLPILLLCLAVKVASANIVVNGGFEDTSPYPGQPSEIRIPTGWTMFDPDTPASVAAMCGSSNAHSGNCAGFLAGINGLASLSQFLSTTPGEQYILTFYLAAAGVPNEIVVTFGGTELLNSTNFPDQPYSVHTFNISASSASTKLEFQGSNLLGAFLLDDVSVTPVPEPSTWVAGLASVLVLKLRRRQGRRGNRRELVVPDLASPESAER